MGSSSYITNLAGEINQHMEYLPFGELLVEEHLSSYNSPFKFNAKEFDSETGNYYYGARYYNPKWSIWLGVDEYYFKYPSLSPYIYTANNPIIYIDPDGKQIVGVTNKDAQNFKADIHRVLADKKFEGVRALIDVQGSTFKSIDAKSLKTALDGVELNADERAYIEMVTNTINSKEVHKVEYISGDYASSEGAAAFKDYMNKLQSGVGDQMLTRDGKLDASIIDMYGGGFNVPTINGSHSFIGSGIQGDERPVISGHEVFGHGIPSSRGLTPKENNANAIRTDNLIRRLLNLPQRDGSNHGGFDQGHITQPQKLPILE